MDDCTKNQQTNKTKRTNKHALMNTDMIHERNTRALTPASDEYQFGQTQPVFMFTNNALFPVYHVHAWGFIGRSSKFSLPRSYSALFLPTAKRSIQARLCVDSRTKTRQNNPDPIASPDAGNYVMTLWPMPSFYVRIRWKL